MGSGGKAAAVAAAIAVAVAALLGWQYLRPGPPAVEPPTAAMPEITTSDPADTAAVETPAEDDSPTPPSFDIVRVDADGNALVAGRAEPGADVKIMLDGLEVSRSSADAGGSFAALFSVPPANVPRVVSLLMEISGTEPVKSTATVILSPSTVAVALAEPETVQDAPVSSTPQDEVVASLETPVDVDAADIDGTPDPTATDTLVAPAVETPAEGGEPADKPEIIAAIKPEPKAALPVSGSDAPAVQDDTTPVGDVPSGGEFRGRGGCGARDTSGVSRHSIY